MTDRYLLDTNIVDRLADEPKLLDDVIRRVRSGALRLLVTHVEADELADHPIDEDRARLLAVLDRLDPESTPTAGFVLGADPTDRVQFHGSRLGRANLFDHERGARHDAYVGDSRRRTEDALLLATAEREGVPFLTAETKPHNLRRMARFFPSVRIAHLDELRAPRPAE